MMLQPSKVLAYMGWRGIYRSLVGLRMGPNEFPQPVDRYL